jgi:hypothetical protein
MQSTMIIEKDKPLHQLTHGSILEKGIRLFLILTIACLFIPLNPAMPMEGLDNSWMFGMNQAVAQKLAFGRDIIFTFGPYASVYTKEYHPATDFLMLLGGTCLALSYSVGALFLINKERWGLGLAYAAVLAGVIFSRDALLFSYALIVAVSAYKAIILRETSEAPNKAITLIMIVLFFCLGLPPLIKGSMLILCGAISILCFLLFALKKEKTLAIIALALPACSTLGFWIVSGQSIYDLPAYISAMVPIASGYTEAMSLEGNTSEILIYLSASALICLGLYRNKPDFKVENIFLWCVFFVFLFLAFKGGFVRHDGHAKMAGISVLIAALIYLAITSSKKNLLISVSCFCAWLYIYNHHITTVNKVSLKHTLAVYTLPFKGFVNRLQDDSWLELKFSAAIQKIKEKSNLPIMRGTTDVYSYNQSNLIASGNIWNTRPILQSYSAYTESLAVKNRDHLLEKNAPDNIVFSVEPIDDRLPPIEDGASWPVLLSQYHPTLFKDNRVFLARNIPTTNYVAPSNILSETHRLGEEILIPDAHTPVFVEIDIKSTLMGHMANILFKPARLKIKVNLSNGTTKVYRITSSLGKSGFILSPLIEYTSEFGLLYGNSSFLDNKKVKSFSISTEDERNISWQNDFSITFKKLELPPSLDVSKVYKFGTITDAKPDYQMVSNGNCVGSIDVINGLPSQNTATTSGLLNVDGWLATSDDEGLNPATPFIALRDKNGQLKLIETRVVERPDVAAAYKKPTLDKAGYTSVADVSGLDGEYTLSLAFKHSDQVKVCPQFKNIVTINNRSSHEDK